MKETQRNQKILERDWPSIDLTNLLEIIAGISPPREKIPFDDRGLEASLELRENMLDITLHPPLAKNNSLYALIGSEVYRLSEKSRGKYTWQLPNATPNDKKKSISRRDRLYLVVVNEDEL